METGELVSEHHQIIVMIAHLYSKPALDIARRVRKEQQRGSIV